MTFIKDMLSSALEVANLMEPMSELSLESEVKERKLYRNEMVHLELRLKIKCSKASQSSLLFSQFENQTFFL